MGIKIDEVYYELALHSKDFGAELAEAESKLANLGNFIKAHPTAAIGGMAAALALVGVEAVKMAVEFDTAMRQVTALLPQVEGQLESLKAQVEGLSTKLPIAAHDLAAALRLIVQTGGQEMQQPAAAIERLNIAAKLSVASGDDLATVIRGLDGAMRAFGLHGNDAAEQLSALLFSMSRGRAPLTEFSSVLERVAPFAEAAGASIEETTALIAALYDRGVPTTVMMRGLRAALGGTGEEGEATKGILQQLGVSVAFAGGQMKVGGAAAGDYTRALAQARSGITDLSAALDHQLAAPGAKWKEFMNVMALGLDTIGDKIITFGENMKKVLEIMNRINNGEQGSTGPTALAWTQGHLSTYDQGHPNALPAGRGSPRGASPMTPEQRAAQLARRNALQARLDGELARITAGTSDAMIVAITKLGEAYDKEFKHHIPESVQASLDQLRTFAATTGDLDSYAAGLKKVQDAVATLDPQGKDTSGFTAQRVALEELRESLTHYLAGLQQGTAEYDRAQALLREINNELRSVGRNEVDAWKAAAARTKEYARQHDTLAQQVRDIEEIARGALQVAEAFGLIGQDAAQMLESIVQVAANIKLLQAAKIDSFSQLFKPENLAAVTGLMGGIGAGVSALAGLFSKSPEQKAEEEALRKNSEAIQALTRQLGEFGLQITGQQFTGVTRGVQDILGSGVHIHDFHLVPNLSPQTAMARLGLTMADLRQVAEQLHITFAGTMPTLQELAQLAQAITQTELTQFASTATGQLEALRHEFEVFDITDPIEQLRRLQQVLAGGDYSDASKQYGYGSPALAGALGGDLSTPEGRAAAETALEALFRQLQNGTLGVGALGALTPDQFLQSLEDALKMLRAADTSVGGQTQNFGVNQSVTEVTGARLAGIMTTDAFWNQKTAENTTRIADLLDSLTTRSSIQPPTMDELNRYAGGGLVVNVTVNVQGAVRPQDAPAVGQAVGAAAVREINRALGQTQRARARAYGRATLN